MEDDIPEGASVVSDRLGEAPDRNPELEPLTVDGPAAPMILADRANACSDWPFSFIAELVSIPTSGSSAMESSAWTGIGIGAPG